MGFVKGIITDLVDESKSLTSALLKSKVVAHKLGIKQLLKWIDAELNGYNSTNVPPYRVIRCQVVGTLTDGSRLIKNALVPIGHLDAKIQESLKTVLLKNSISNLEEFLKCSNSPKLVIVIPPEMCQGLSAFLKNYNILSANKEIDRTQIIQLLTNVRTKLLEFLMELQNEIGNNIETMDSKKIDNDKVDKIFNTSITGNGNVLVFGDHNYQNITNKILKGSIKDIKKTFLQVGLSGEDVNELEEAINTDTPDIQNKAFGTKVKAWISKMFNKAQDCIWAVGVDTAGKLLTEAIKKYYGF